MKLKLRKGGWVWAGLISLFGVVVYPARGQGFYLVEKSQIFTQTSSAGAVADPSVPFEFSAEAVVGATMTLPTGGTQVLPYSSGNQNYRVGYFFSSKAALDAAYPDGTYGMSGPGIPALSFNLTPDTYPAVAPQLTNGSWNSGGVLVVDPTQSTTITVNTFTGFATSGLGGHMQIQIQGMTDNVQLNSEVISVANPFGIAVQSTPLTSITIPAGTLTSGRAYQGSVSFDTALTFSATTVPGAGVVALFSKALNFVVAAQAPGTSTPPPVIGSQPQNQTAVLGGSATINLGVTVGGSSQFGNLSSDWFFNGQLLNVDGTKYAPSTTGFGLTIKNLTAADAGNYTVRIINAGGIVNSNPATLTVTAAAGPTIASQPAAQTVPAGSTVVFNVAASGAPAPSYQWQRNGSPIAGATSATLVLTSLTGNNAAVAGNYSVVVSNGVGSPVTSAPAALNVVATPDVGRLINLSVLTDISAAVTNFTVATVVGGAGTSGTKPILVRADGPSLGALGVAGTIPDPQLTLFNSSSVAIVTNDNWGSDPTAVAALTTAMASVGAFAFTGAASKDAAVFQPALAPGGYTVQVSGVNGSVGTALAEIYDATPAGTYNASTPRLINVSALKQINVGGSLTLGFTVGGSTARTVLIRAIGPGLAGIGVTNGTLVDPQLTLYNSNSVAIAANNDWGGDPQISAAANRVGAFAIANPASKDAMLLITLASGGYTAKASGADGGGGLAIVEVYEVP